MCTILKHYVKNALAGFDVVHTVFIQLNYRIVKQSMYFNSVLLANEQKQYTFT